MHVVNTTHAGSYCPHLHLAPGEEPLYLCIPMIAQGETMGVLHLRNERVEGEQGPLPDNKQRLAITVVDHITLALANLNLRETLRAQSIRDALTGLFNRRYLEESLPRELARAKRRGATLGMIMLDVDRFKQINDTFGHEAGDTILNILGQWLQANVRGEDISCRYGGDEFVLILPEASLEDTRKRAQQICEGARRLKIEHQGQSLGSMTVSVGVAAFPAHGETRGDLLRAVDVALYKAKAGGRNWVAVADKNIHPEL